ncbi:MAG: hypothetical protein MRT15_10935, partial [archaeon YNP-LCB-003-016]|uniref:hypothetical protein n=1 Tax=Candidatus Culexarchaeum yellowstonense TaxID=2928963 RepID=UPI0026EFD03B
MPICDRCGRWFNFIVCPYCGYVPLYADRGMFLRFMEGLLYRERAEEKRRVERDKVVGELIDVAGDTVTIDCGIPRFEEGDV